ncbi:hypothetical protein SDC9_127640 [bioreactor metagenome]|uniref:Uncharacterized protein n=1 Tax=bioreactor metagenome TaxID=1076179 RepID=A0A645CUM2_9ZZZZ
MGIDIGFSLQKNINQPDVVGVFYDMMKRRPRGHAVDRITEIQKFGVKAPEQGLVRAGKIVDQNIECGPVIVLKRLDQMRGGSVLAVPFNQQYTAFFGKIRLADLFQ